MRTIVVGYDDTEPARRALDRAVALAKAFDSRVVVTTVAPVTTPAAGRSIGADPADTGGDHMVELAHARALIDAAGVPAEYVEALGHPADAIVTTATQHGAELIVVGTREPGFLERMLGTSVSDAVSHRAHCDVLIVH